MSSKFTSRKFWFAVAAFLSSLGTGILGMANIIPEHAMPYVVTGNICVVVAAAIYNFCEAYVDGKSAASVQSITQITANTNNKEIVQSALGQTEVPVETK